MRGLLLAVLALLLVAGDSGRYASQLVYNVVQVYPANKEIASANSTYLQSLYSSLWYAAKSGNQKAQSMMVAWATEHGSVYWLKKLVSLENAEAAWALYQLIGEAESNAELMALAAIGNVPEAQLAFAMDTDNPNKREKWLLRAAKLNYLPAQSALADWYLLQGKLELARPWLEKTASLDMQSAFKYGRLLWDENLREEALKYFQQAADAGHTKAAEVIMLLSQYSPKAANSVGEYTWPTDKTCLQRIQIFATSLSTISRANALYEQFEQDLRLQALPLCIAPPIWLENNQLDCHAQYQGNNRLGCNIKPLGPAVTKRTLTHAVVVAEQGKANVQNGVMFLDMSDDYSVFVHELAHFAGFIDEYPLPKSSAQRYCHPEKIADFSVPNLVIEGAITYHPMATVNQWHEAVNAAHTTLTIASARTCDASGIKAYKPSHRITFMEHHDVGVIPPLYLTLWRQQLHNPDTQRPISMNLFQAFHQSGRAERAGYWLAEYESRASVLHELSEPVSE